MATTATTAYTSNPLPDFSRNQWASGKARSDWEPRITSIGQHFASAERSSVEAGIRSAALQVISPEGLPELAKSAADRGLVTTPLHRQGRPERYAAGTQAVPEAGPWDFRVVLTTHGGTGAFVRAWKNADDDALGEMLGYPPCCRDFFARTWGSGSCDPTWEMDTIDTADGPIEANILLRWLGVRAVPHMPCGFHCDGTIELGRAMLGRMPETERGWLDELLSMPMLWSSLYGIGEVVTPIVTLNFRSDHSTELREIRRTGTGYPEAGADGLRFPFRPPPARRAPDSTPEPAKEPKKPDLPVLTADKVVELGAELIDNSLGPAKWEDNGFSTLEAQELAHGVIASVLPGKDRSVFDLGCGNGILARRIAGGGMATGIELVTERAARAQSRLDDVICGDLFGKISWSAADVVLFMPGRLTEAARPGTVDAFIDPRAFLVPLGYQLVVYAYGDWLKPAEGLEALCHKAGMTGELTEKVEADGVEAGIWRWK